MKEQIDKLTWRENRVLLKTNAVTTQFFSDTKPNHILVTNQTGAMLYLSIKGDASKDNYNIKIPANAQKLLPRPIGVDRCSFYHEQGYDVSVTIATWEGNFEPASLSQSLETVSIDPTSPEVEIANDAGNPIPVNGNVTVGNFPTIQQVHVDNIPATQNVFVTGNKAQYPFISSVGNTFTFPTPMNALVLNNDGASDVSVQIGVYTFVVKPGKQFNEYLAPFTQIITTATTAYSGYVRG